jgi:sphingosine kinase
MGNPILASTLNVIRGRRTPLDLVKVTTRSNTFYSFLSIGWGLLADMDIESERLRFMGGFRFTVYGIIRTCGESGPSL